MARDFLKSHFLEDFQLDDRAETRPYRVEASENGLAGMRW